MTDQEALSQYSDARQDAFRLLVDRYLALVYSAARRQVGDTHLAEDVTQAVFIVLARKAHALQHLPVLAGWLLQTTHWVCRDAIRAESRRRHHESLAARQRQEAGTMNENAVRANWAGQLDQALTRLPRKDADVLALRFFQNKTGQEIGAVLGVSAEAGQKRVERALVRLRQALARCGVTGTQDMLGAELEAQATVAIPLGLDAAVLAAMAGHGSAAGTATLAGLAAKKVLWAMFWAKVKVAAAVCAILVAGVATGVLIHAWPVRPPIAAVIAPPAPATTRSEPQDAEKVTYTAVVRGSDGKPVAGAKVRLERQGWDRPGTQVDAQAVTQADGSFLLGPVAEMISGGLAGSPIIMVDAPGQAWGGWTGELADLFNDQAIKQIRLAKADTVAGVVVDEAGKPVSGATVEMTVEVPGQPLLRFGQSTGRGATTDAAGKFTIPRVPAGSRATITVSCPGYVRYSSWDGGADQSPPVAAGTQDVRVTLQRGAQVNVQLLRGNQEYRKAGVIVGLFETAGGRGQGGEFTDAQGLAVVQGLRPGKYSLHVGGPVLSADGLIAPPGQDLDLKPGDAPAIRLECVPGRMLHVRVTQAGLPPASRVRVEIVRTAPLLPVFTGPPAADGRIATAVDTGTYVIRAMDAHGTRLPVDGPKTVLPVTVEPAKDPPEVELKIGQAVTWRGRLVDEQGQAVQGCVVASAQRAKVAPDGRFELPIEDRPELAIAWDREKTHAKLFLYSKEPAEQEIRLEPMGELHGHVELPAGRQIDELALTAWVKTGPDGSQGWWNRFADFQVQPDGQFRLAPFPVGAPVYISATIKGAEAYTNPVRLRPGQTTDVGTLQLQADRRRPQDAKAWDATVRGRVVNEKGEPVHGLQMGAQLIGAGVGAITDLEGRFEMNGLPHGKVTLCAERSGYGYCHFEVTAPSENTPITMVPMGWEWYGKQAPEVIVDQWASGKIEGIRELKGKVVLLVVGASVRAQWSWASWQGLQEKYGPRGLVVVVVHRHIPDQDEGARPGQISAQEVEEKVAKMGLAVALDDRRDRGPAPQEWRGYGATEAVYSVREPGGQGAVFLIDRKGLLQGVLKTAEVEPRLQDALRDP